MANNQFKITESNFYDILLKKVLKKIRILFNHK